MTDQAKPVPTEQEIERARECWREHNAPVWEWLAGVIAEAEARGARERDMQWWEQTILVDNVASTPEAGKAWAATMQQYAFEQGKAEGAREERARFDAVLGEARDAMEIPFYAYGENEAACRFASVIEALVCAGDHREGR